MGGIFFLSLVLGKQHCVMWIPTYILICSIPRRNFLITFLTTVIVLENYFNKLELSFLTAAICKQVLANKFLFSGISWTETAILIICTFMLSWLFIYRDRNLILVTKFAPFIVLLAIHRQCVQLKNQLQRVTTYSYRDVQKVFGHCNFLLYISYKTTFFKNIIPKSTLVRFWWYFLLTKAELKVVLHCNFRIIV